MIGADFQCNFFSALGLELIVGIRVANRFAPAPRERLRGEDMASKRIRLSGATRRPVAAGTLASMLAALLLATLTFAAPYLSAGKDKKDKKDKLAQSKTLKGLPITELSEDEAILHAFNRLGFGPRPGDIERVRQIGLGKWIEQQLNPDSINDSALQSRLERFPTLTMSASKLLDEFPQPMQAAKKAGLSREEYQRQREQQAKQREERQKMQDAAQPGDSAQMQEGDKPATSQSAASDQPAASPGDNSKPARLGGNRQGFGGDTNTPPMRLEDSRAPQRIVAELAMAKMTRAIYSERQLYEEMVDFWFNHFNVYAAKGADKWLLTSYERDVIRPHAMGKFKDLLFATAKSPAMLFYLDNWLSADPKSFERLQRELAEHRQRFYGLYGMNDPF